MKRSVIPYVLIAVAVVLACGNPSLANTGKPASAAKTENALHASPAKHSSRPQLVDINCASKAQLKELPGIDDATAGRIIAGRPYLSKAFLVTNKIISLNQYEAIKARVIAMQNAATAAKLKELEQGKH